MTLRFELCEERPVCGARRGPKAHTYCELPPDHVTGGATGTPMTEYNHTGRDRSGAWHSWPPKPRSLRRAGA